MLNRLCPNGPSTSINQNGNHPTVAIDAVHVGVFKKTLAYDLTCIAKLGGYLARKSDLPPGNLVIWRGLTRLADIVLGLTVTQKLMDN